MDDQQPKAGEQSQGRPVTTEDFYGASAGAGSSTGTPLPGQPSEKPPLAYEETPIIEPIKEETPTAPAPEPSPPAPPIMSSSPSLPKPKQRGFRSFLKKLVFLGILLALGIWLNSQLRPFFAPIEPGAPFPSPTRPFSISPTPSPPATPSAWREYQVLNGRTRQPIEGVTYELPPEVLAPVCDGTGCASQGTYLPGGTRFTVAARGKGQVLPDFRGAILTDASGREFIMKQSTIGGRSVSEYTGNFTGSTGGGYTFTQMQGVLVAITDTLAIEFNHFAPAGISSDFAADEVVFDKIVESLNRTSSSGSLTE